MHYPYKNHAVRDLAWACFEPPLILCEHLPQNDSSIKNCALELTPAREAWLLSLDEDPRQLLEHIAQIRSHRLGIYFEGLWHFFLDQDQSVDLVAHNLQVRHGGKTLGEFDCLYYCHQRQRHYHLELAVKYFLSHRIATTSEDRSHCNEWWGPECQDRLDLKIDHVLNRQIRLADHPAASTLLAELGIAEVGREVEIKGYLFQSADDPLPPPADYNAATPLAKWVSIDELPRFCEVGNWANFLILPKFRWLSPACDPHSGDTLDMRNLHPAIQAHFAAESRPQLVAALDDTGREHARFFVVGRHWPEPDG